MGPRTGGRILVDQLVAQGVERVTCVPGESYLAALDALQDSGIDVLVCRQEGGAAMMAEAEGKLSGRPGVCFVTRGPGSTNASSGVHVAQQDSTPLILFVGQVARRMRERDAFQEVDFKSFFGGMAKWVVEVDSAARLPELIARAFRTAMQGRPGPVVVALPEDMLREEAIVADAPRVEPAWPAPAPGDMEELAHLLASAEAPIAVVGGGAWTERAGASFAAFAERFALPVATSFRRAGLVPADHPFYAGDISLGPNPKLAARIREADLLLLVGGRMSEPSSSYSLIDIPVPKQKLVHVHPSAEELGRVYQPTLAIESAPGPFAAALDGMNPSVTPRWSNRSTDAHRDYLEWTEKPSPAPGAFHFGEALVWLRERLPADAIAANGAGNYAAWLHRYYRHRRFGTQLAPTSGSMGYGVPAAIMAKRRHPDRTVVAFAGDGCFLMTGQEFATAVQFGIALVIVVIDNGIYGTIRMHQEREYPGRTGLTSLTNPDFAAYARAFGGHGERVERTADFAPAFERALASGKPAIVHCLMDPEAIVPGRTLTAIREDALKRKR